MRVTQPSTAWPAVRSCWRRNELVVLVLFGCRRRSLFGKGWVEMSQSRLKQSTFGWAERFRCSKCKKEKTRSSFNKTASRKSGIMTVCRQCDKVSVYDWQNKNKERYGFRLLKNAAKRTRRIIDISYEEYCKIITLPCFYCEEPIWQSNKKYSEFGHGLDRIDNNKGYLKSNVIPACGSCNRGRSDIFTVEEWRVAIAAVKSYRLNKPDLGGGE